MSCHQKYEREKLEVQFFFSLKEKESQINEKNLKEDLWGFILKVANLFPVI